MSKGADLTGLRFGRLVVKGEAERRSGIVWLCVCDCGTEHKAKTGHLNAGVVLSCGCAQRDAGRETSRLHSHKLIKHGLSRSRLDNIFDNMLKRCYSPSVRSYADYGARGIRICDEWRSNRSVFYAWAMGNGYREDLQIERNDPDGNYCPGNCSWKTPKEQQNNTRRNRRIDWDGKNLTVAQWAECLGVAPGAVLHRLDRGWSAERIFTQPFRGAA